jgi:hypothetical protein
MKKGKEFLEVLQKDGCERSHECPKCKENINAVGLTDLVYTFESHNCIRADYPHLVEVAWHRDCFVDPMPANPLAVNFIP